MDRAFEGLLRTGGLIQPPPSPPQYLGLYLSVANKTWKIYKTNQNKVIDIKKNYADIAECCRCHQKLKGVRQNFGISNIFIKNRENAKICFELLQNIK